jgi:hypothetical protein
VPENLLAWDGGIVERKGIIIIIIVLIIIIV